MANADTLYGAGVNSGNALDAAKLQNNSETTKDKESKKHCHRRTTEHEPNRVANSSSRKERWKPPPFLMMRNINMPSFPSLMVQRYEIILRPPKIRSKKKDCLLSYHSALIAGASVKAAHGAALLSELSSTEEPGCSELLRPAVCSFRTIASVLRRMESRTSAIIGYCLKLPGRTCVPGTFPHSPLGTWHRNAHGMVT